MRTRAKSKGRGGVSPPFVSSVSPPGSLLTPKAPPRSHAEQQPMATLSRIAEAHASIEDVRVGPHSLPGTLTIPDDARGIVIFAHGSGSSRHSPRNVHAAHRLQKAGFATLLFDLLSDAEAQDRRNVFDIPLLGQRVVEAVDWLRTKKACAHLPIGLFGASTGAAAAIVAAMERCEEVQAVVSRGGRPDLADGALDAIRAPTLLLVGGHDGEVLALNRRAMARMRCETNLEIVPRAGHLFEEPGTLDAALDYATEWFVTYLGREP